MNNNSNSNGFSVEIKGISLKFLTNDEVFSPKSVDKGTLAMLEVTEFTKGDKVIDLGCGYGVVGILASRIVGEENVIMCDISESAVGLARKNAELNGVCGADIRLSDGFSNIGESDFTLILSNPPYHTDFSVPKGFIEQGFKKLALGGKMIMVTKRLDWYKNKLKAVFGGVRVSENDGYFVFVAEKRAVIIPQKQKNVNKLSRKLRRKYGEK